jgi:hypothetical protein
MCLVEDLVTRRASEVERNVEGVVDPATLSAPLRAELERAEDRLRAWARDAAAAGLSPGEIRAGREPLVEERDGIAAELEAVAPKSRSSWAELEDLLQNMSDPTPVEWRAYIEQITDHVFIGPAKTSKGKLPLDARVRIVWAHGVEPIDSEPMPPTPKRAAQARATR